MKKVIILLMAFPLLFAGCGKINAEIEELKNRIANLEGTTIASIEQQIASINKSIGDLNGMDTSLKGYLDALIWQLVQNCAHFSHNAVIFANLRRGIIPR